eukprot:2012721-Rhodomonas_salina.2
MHPSECDDHERGDRKGRKARRSQRTDRAVWERTVVIDDDVAGLSGGVGADHALDRHDLADVRVLLLGDVDRHTGLVPVRLGLEEVEVAVSGNGRARGAGHRSAVIRHLGHGAHVQLLRQSHAARAPESCNQTNGRKVSMHMCKERRRKLSEAGAVCETLRAPVVC